MWLRCGESSNKKRRLLMITIEFELINGMKLSEERMEK